MKDSEAVSTEVMFAAIQQNAVTGSVELPVNNWIETLQLGTAHTAHVWGEWTVTTPVTCTDDGVETRTCQVCGETESRSVEAAGHQWDGGTVTKEPTENAVGEKVYICAVCGEKRTEEIPATGKTPSEPSTEESTEESTETPGGGSTETPEEAPTTGDRGSFIWVYLMSVSAAAVMILYKKKRSFE